MVIAGAELLEIARKGRPNVRYEMHRNGSMIGAWSETLGRFVIVAARTLDDHWCDMPCELLVNGQPTHTADDWNV
jgi:hypothetical protein